MPSNRRILHSVLLANLVVLLLFHKQIGSYTFLQSHRLFAQDLSGAFDVAAEAFWWSVLIMLFFVLMDKLQWSRMIQAFNHISCCYPSSRVAKFAKPYCLLLPFTLIIIIQSHYQLGTIKPEQKSNPKFLQYERFSRSFGLLTSKVISSDIAIVLMAPEIHRYRTDPESMPQSLHEEASRSPELKTNKSEILVEQINQSPTIPNTAGEEIDLKNATADELSENPATQLLNDDFTDTHEWERKLYQDVISLVRLPLQKTNQAWQKVTGNYNFYAKLSLERSPQTSGAELITETTCGHKKTSFLPRCTDRRGCPKHITHPTTIAQSTQTESVAQSLPEKVIDQTAVEKSGPFETPNAISMEMEEFDSVPVSLFPTPGTWHSELAKASEPASNSPAETDLPIGSEVSQDSDSATKEAEFKPVSLFPKPSTLDLDSFQDAELSQTKNAVEDLPTSQAKLPIKATAVEQPGPKPFPSSPRQKIVDSGSTLAPPKKAVFSGKKELENSVQNAPAHTFVLRGKITNLASIGPRSTQNTSKVIHPGQIVGRVVWREGETSDIRLPVASAYSEVCGPNIQAKALNRIKIDSQTSGVSNCVVYLAGKSTGTILKHDGT